MISYKRYSYINIRIFKYSQPNRTVPMNATSNYTGFPVGATPTGTSGDIFILAIVLIMSVRVFRGMKGTKFSMYRVIGIPILYMLITIGSIAYSTMTSTEYAIAIVAFAIGALLGTRFGKSTKFFDKDEQTYYKRSAVVITVWLVSFAFRDIIPMIVTNVPWLTVAVNMVLALTTGMIIGESIHIYREYKSPMDRRNVKRGKT